MNVPNGYRFLIQLVDAKSMADAKREIVDMFGREIAAICEYVPGTEQPKKEIGMHGVPIISDNYRKPWIACKSGWSVFLPNGRSVKRTGEYRNPHEKVGGAK